MPTRQTTIRFAERTDQQLEELISLFGDKTKTVSIAIDRLYQAEIASRGGVMQVRKFAGYNQSIVGGDYTQEELDAVRQIGTINAYRQDLDKVLREAREFAPAGWRVASGKRSHNRNPELPNRQDAATEPILIGWCTPVHGDPPISIWAFKHT